MIRLPDPCLVVLVGPSGSGKSVWSDEWSGPQQVVSSDRLRALVGEGEHDQRAGTDAFAVLDSSSTAGSSAAFHGRRHALPDARQLDDARLPRRPHLHGRGRAARHGDHLPQRGAPGQDRRHPRRALRRSAVGAAWFEHEHKAYGWDFPPARERLDLLEDALEVAVLHGHCAAAGRDSADVRVTHLSGILVADEAHARANVHPRTIVGNVEDHVGRSRELAEAGVQTAMVRLADLAEPGALERFAEIIDAFRR